MKIPGLTTRQCRMLAKHGFHGAEEINGAVCIQSPAGILYQIGIALQVCREIRRQQWNDKYRASRKPQLAAYARTWRAEHRDRARDIINRCGRAKLKEPARLHV